MSGTLIQERQTIFRLTGICSKRSKLSTSPRLLARHKERFLERASAPSRLQSSDRTIWRQRYNSTMSSTHQVCRATCSPSAQFTTSDTTHGLHLAKGSGYFTTIRQSSKPIEKRAVCSASSWHSKPRRMQRQHKSTRHESVRRKPVQHKSTEYQSWI